MAFTIRSAAFDSEGTIPTRFTCDADDVSPPLEWEGAPDGTHSYALICDDTDAPAGTWVHWVLFGLPPGTTALPEGVPAAETGPGGSKQGLNDFKRLGYGGPCPPKGAPHRYYFKLYALDAPVDLEPGATKADLLEAMDGLVLAEAQLMGKYARKSNPI